MQLEIKNFAIIEHSIITFDETFNVLTGETGAGKSILLDALGAILGDRTSKDYIRKGEEKAELKAVFLCTEKINQKLRKKNIHVEDDVVIVRREIQKSGRSISKINGSIQTVQTIRDIFSDIIEIIGQRDHQQLLSESKYLELLDEKCDNEHQETLTTYQNLFREYQDVLSSLDSLENTQREQVQLLDLYRFQVQEIESAQLKEGEDAELEKEKAVLSNFSKIEKHVIEANQGFNALSVISDVERSIQDAARFDPKLSKLAERVTSVRHELDDIASEMNMYQDGFEYDEAKLDGIIYRLETINQLKRKYGVTIEDILVHYDEVSQKLDEVVNKDAHVERLKNEKNRLESKLSALASTLHTNREQTGVRLEKAILTELQELCMPDARLEFLLTQTDSFMSTGWTNVSLLFNANKGEDLKPLAKIASGGELSRVLLALKVSTSSSNEIESIVFDEVDEGVGGEVGLIIGKKLAHLGKYVQLIVISHLPQVAAKADTQFLIHKESNEERTYSTVKKLSEQERKLEIARMIYGDDKSETTLKQAEEMLKK